MKKMTFFAEELVRFVRDPNSVCYNCYSPYCDEYPKKNKDRKIHEDCRVGYSIAVVLLLPFIPLITFIQVPYYGLNLDNLGKEKTKCGN